MSGGGRMGRMENVELDGGVITRVIYPTAFGTHKEPRPQGYPQSEGFKVSDIRPKFRG